MAQGPMADTDTAGTVECEVQAGASDAEGCGMDASDDFEVFAEAAVLDLGVEGIVADGPGDWQRQGGVTTQARARMPHVRTGRALAHAPTPRSLRAGQPNMCRRPATPRRS